MNRRTLEKLREELRRLRRGSPNANDVQKLAKKLGRRKVKRGKEPTWESTEFDELYPLTIPDHGGKDLSPGVKHSVLNQLEDDIIAWGERLSEQNFGNGNDVEY